MSKLITMEALVQAQNGIEAEGVLFFLPEKHFLFRYKGEDGWQSKFMAPEDVAASFTGAENDTGWLSEGVIRAGRSHRGDWFVYTAPAQKRTLTLTTGEVGEITIPTPAMVLIGVGHKYYLFAAQDKTVTARSQIYHAPFPNVYEHGLICWGNNHRPKAHHRRAATVLDLFFSTPFNSHMANKKSKSCDKDVNDKLRELAKKGSKAYPIHDLYEAGTLESMAQRVLDRDWSD